MDEKKRPVVLLVEDDPLLIKMYTTKFTKDGFELLTAQDGEEGLRIATERDVDFIILDLLMPKLSGAEMLSLLRRTEKGRAIPVMILTNLAQQEDAAKLTHLDIKEYLVKANLTPAEVVAKVKGYLLSTPK